MDRLISTGVDACRPTCGLPGPPQGRRDPGGGGHGGTRPAPGGALGGQGPARTGKTPVYRFRAPRRRHGAGSGGVSGGSIPAYRASLPGASWRVWRGSVAPPLDAGRRRAAGRLRRQRPHRPRRRPGQRQPGGQGRGRPQHRGRRDRQGHRPGRRVGRRLGHGRQGPGDSRPAEDLAGRARRRPRRPGHRPGRLGHGPYCSGRERRQRGQGVPFGRREYRCRGRRSL